MQTRISLEGNIIERPSDFRSTGTMQSHRVTSSLAALALLLAHAAFADIVFVSANGTGTYATIQEAISSVPDGSIVYLLSGTYTGPGNRGLVLSDKNVSLMVFGAQGSAIVDCEGLNRALRTGAGVDSSSVISGLEFRNGIAPSGSGGAIDCLNAGPTVRDCTFRGNSAVYGGAIRARGEPAPNIEGCVFVDNSAVYGGAIDARDVAIHVSNSTFGNNVASRGGGMCFTDCSPTVTNCTMCLNSADYGAAMKLFGSVAKIEKCIVALNRTNEALSGEEASETSYCCVFGNADGDVIDGDAHDNFVTDPLMCDPGAGDYHLCANSYCLPSGNPWSCHIGHQANGCESCTSPVRDVSWGILKATYR